MKYLIVGAGGTGGAIAGYLGRAGYDVTVIARGDHLKAIQRSGGLSIIRPKDRFSAPVKASDTDHYNETPDVIFVCVKGYSLDSVMPFIAKTAGSNTIVIPILNIYGTGAEMQKRLPGVLVTDGCIYVPSEKKEPGVILLKGDIFRLVFGVRNKEDFRPELEMIRDDLVNSGIEGILSDNIQRDFLIKFSYVSPQGVCGLLYDIPAGPIQKKGKYRDTFVELVREIEKLANAMGVRFDKDIVEYNLKIVDGLSPEMTTSMQKDIAAGRQSEIDGLLFGVVRLAKKYNLTLPFFEKAASALEKYRNPV